MDPLAPHNNINKSWVSYYWALHTSHSCDGAAQASADQQRHGINAPGLLALVQALVADGLYDVCVCGPADEQVSSCPSSSPRAQSQFTKFCRLLSSEAWCGNRAAALLREPSAVCWSSAPQALTSFAGVQSAKSHAITLGRPLVSYPIEVPQTAEAYAVRVPLHVSQLRTALSAGASTRMHDLACT